MMKRLVLALIVAVFLRPASAATATQEIDHLLAFVAQSPCTFIRNGDEYRGADAADHLRRKYDHFQSEIASAENFIRLAATRSEMSGRPYEVRCGQDAAMPLANWLQTELVLYRKSTP